MLRQGKGKDMEISWMIDGREISLSNEILGRGNNGDVIKAQLSTQYRGITVAIKTLFLDWEVRRVSMQDHQDGSQPVAADSLVCRADLTDRGDLAEVISIPDNDFSGIHFQKLHRRDSFGIASIASPTFGPALHSESSTKQRISRSKASFRRASVGCMETREVRSLRLSMSEPRLRGRLSSVPNQRDFDSPLDEEFGLNSPLRFAPRNKNSSAINSRRHSFVCAGDNANRDEILKLNSTASLPWCKSGSFLTRYNGEGHTPVANNSTSWGRSLSTDWGVFNSWLDSKLSKASLQNEIKALVAIRHPCITTIMGATVIEIQGQKRLCLVVELMELGSLWDLLHNETFILCGKQVLRQYSLLLFMNIHNHDLSEHFTVRFSV
jgi:hypothetical protein